MTKAELVKELIELNTKLENINEGWIVEEFHDAILAAGKPPSFMYDAIIHEDGTVELDFDQEYNLHWDDWNLADLDVAKLKELISKGKELLEKAEKRSCESKNRKKLSSE
jgi:hypothetical protein